MWNQLYQNLPLPRELFELFLTFRGTEYWSLSLEQRFPYDRSVGSLSLSGRFLLWLDDDRLHLYETFTLCLLWENPLTDQTLCEPVWAPDEESFVTVTEPWFTYNCAGDISPNDESRVKVFCIRSVKKGEILWTFQPYYYVYNFDWDSSGILVSQGSRSNYYSKRSRTRLVTPDERSLWPSRSVRFHPQTEQIAVSSGEVYLSSLSERLKPLQTVVEEKDPSLQHGHGLQEFFELLAWSPSGRWLAMASVSRLRLWDSATNEFSEIRFSGHRERIVWSPDERFLIVGTFSAPLLYRRSPLEIVRDFPHEKEIGWGRNGLILLGHLRKITLLDSRLIPVVSDR